MTNSTSNSTSNSVSDFGPETPKGVIRVVPYQCQQDPETKKLLPLTNGVSRAGYDIIQSGYITEIYSPAGDRVWKLNQVYNTSRDAMEEARALAGYTGYRLEE